jgi:selenocysteine lyase/cysteine desulfurase
MAAHTAVVLGGGTGGIVTAQRLRRELDARDRVVAIERDPYADSQLADHIELLRANVLGNPHSINPTSSVATELVERARASVLSFFRASPDEYVAIFTPNATGALRLVGEAYPFRAGDRFLLTFDNHNSVKTIHTRVEALGSRLLDTLGSLRHANGAPAATIYGPRDFESRGATIAFNFLHPDGRIIDERYVDRLAGQHNISLRTGCFCNRAPARSPSQSPAKRSSAASSATA